MVGDDAPTNEEAVFAAAMEIRDPAERVSFLRSACRGDESLINSVTELLRLAEAPDSFLDGHATTEAFYTLLIGEGTHIGPYKLLQKLGQGGFGVVYMAEQTEPVRRKVALKIIKPGMDTAEVIARFEAERQALAMMDHPNIAKVFDAGTTSVAGTLRVPSPGNYTPSEAGHGTRSVPATFGYPYFVMELVHGEPITTFADSRQLSIRQRLALFVQVCRAVQHAHQKGVIHRDLKPTNVMVTLHDGIPVPKIIDFGVAKALTEPLTHRTLFTRYGTMVGTPQYMSPEQAEMSGLGVDTRSDVYSLGILLYELLTGRPPITSESLQNAGIDEIRRVIKDVDPPTPSMCVKKLPADTAQTVAANRSTQFDPLGKRIRGDLDRIAMKALSKDREQRYESTSALADDVERHLAGDPVLAVAPSYWYSIRKLAVKRRSLFATAAAVAASILVGLSFFAWQFRETLAARDSLQRELYQSEMLEAQAAWDENNFDRMIELLKRWDPVHANGTSHDYRDIAWYFLWKLAESTSASKRIDLDDVGVAVAFSRNARLVAISEPQRTLLWDSGHNTMREIATHPESHFYSYVDFSPDDQWVICPHEDPSSVQLVGILEGSTHQLPQDGAVNQAAFSDDGKWLAIGHKKGATLWHRTHADPAAWKKQNIPWSGAGATAVAFSVDSTELYLGTSDSRVLSLDLGAGDREPVERFSHETFKVWDITSFGDLVASAGKDVRIFDRERKQVVQTIGGHQDEVRGVCFSPDGKELVLGGRDGSITVWDTAGYALVGRLHGHSGIVQGLDAASLPGGSWRLASASQDYTMRLWEMPKAIQARHIQTDEPVIAAVLSAEAASITYATTRAGRTLETDFLGPFPLFGATAQTIGARMHYLSMYCIHVRDLNKQADGSSVTREENFNWIALSASSTFAIGMPDGRVKIGNVMTGELAEIRLSLPVNTRHEEALAAISRNGRWLAISHGEGSISVWNIEAKRWDPLESTCRHASLSIL